MGILVSRVGQLYEAEVTPPQGNGTPWSSTVPLRRDDLFKALVDQGCHQTDIGDAFYKADPEWLLRDQPC
jgi:hypothetical protein